MTRRVPTLTCRIAPIKGPKHRWRRAGRLDLSWGEHRPEGAMKFGLFGGAKASRGGPTSDSHGYRDFIDYVVEAEELGFHASFLVEHHFTGYGQVSASLSLLSFLAARTSAMRLGTAGPLVTEDKSVQAPRPSAT